MGNRTNTRNMHKLRKEFYLQGKRQAASPDPEVRALAECWNPGCVMPTREIDYIAKPGTTDASHHLDHYHTVEDRPDLQEDPDNFRHSHMLCNLKRGKHAPKPGLGTPVKPWW
jgi:hypothetical protein